MKESISKKKLETMVKKLLKAGVEITESSFPSALCIRFPGERKQEGGRIILDTSEEGLLWPESSLWEVHRIYNQATGVLRSILSKARGWKESNPPKFSELVKSPEKIKGLYSPADTAS